MTGPRLIARSFSATCDDAPVGRVELTFDARILRRKVLSTADGRSLLVDLPRVTSLDDGSALLLETGGEIAVTAAAEPVLVVTGANLARLAWHVGNRHTPCQIESDRLIVPRDAVIARMLEHLGARVTEAVAPFTPEGGAYGHGRTHSHARGAHV